MALPVREQAKYWGAAAIALCLALWFLGSVLLPFVLGGAIAYFLDPVADRLERAGLSRAAATGVITVTAILVMMPIALVVIGTFLDQLSRLANFSLDAERLTQIENDLKTFLPNFLAERVNFSGAIDTLSRLFTERGSEVFNAIGKRLFDVFVSSANSLLTFAMLLVIVPVVAVYMLLDWDRMIERIDALLPLDHRDTVRQIAREIDGTLSAFVRGMGTVCLILGAYYAIALMVVRLDFGLVVGIIAGLVTFIPYVGAILGGALAIGLGLFQFWGDWATVMMIAGIFAIGQVAEGNYLTPKLVGSSVGLHPVWLMLALSVFGWMFGFVGMLVAVPLAASIGVLVRFATTQYTSGRLYKGHARKEDV